MATRVLRVALVVAGVIALVTGAWGLLGLDDGLYDVRLDRHVSGHLMLDSNLRYLSGLWLGVGLAMLAVVRSAARRSETITVISCAVFLGGVGRLVSLADAGRPPVIFLAFAALELAFPLLIPLARVAARDQGSARDQAST